MTCRNRLLICNAWVVMRRMKALAMSPNEESEANYRVLDLQKSLLIAVRTTNA